MDEKVPLIPPGVVLYTKLPLETNVIPYPPELIVEFEDGQQHHITGGFLSYPESNNRESFDAMVLNLSVHQLWESVKAPGLFHFNRHVSRWSATRV